MVTDRTALALGLLDTPEWDEVFDSVFTPEPVSLGSDGWDMIYDEASSERFGKKDVATVIAMKSGNHRYLLLQLKDGRYAFLESEETSDGHNMYTETRCLIASRLPVLLRHGLNTKERRHLGLPRQNQ